MQASIGLLLGEAFLYVADRIRFPTFTGEFPTEAVAEGPRVAWRRSALLMLAMTLHNFPQGRRWASASWRRFWAPATALTIGIGSQNIPEGLAIALPLRYGGIFVHAEPPLCRRQREREHRVLEKGGLDLHHKAFESGHVSGSSRYPPSVRAVLPAVESKPCAAARRNCALLTHCAPSKSGPPLAAALTKNSPHLGNSSWRLLRRLGRSRLRGRGRSLARSQGEPPVKLSVIALDYDGTIARGDVFDPSVRDAIAAARTHGIVVLLVTGREDPR